MGGQGERLRQLRLSTAAGIRCPPIPPMVRLQQEGLQDVGAAAVTFLRSMIGTLSHNCRMLR